MASIPMVIVSILLALLFSLFHKRRNPRVRRIDRAIHLI